MQIKDTKITHISLNSLLRMLKFAKSCKSDRITTSANEIFMHALALLQEERRKPEQEVQAIKPEQEVQAIKPEQETSEAS
jgi:hypothetical protein